MTIAPKLRQFLDRQGAVYEIVGHAPTHNSLESAAAARIPPSCLAKAVLLDTPDDLLLAVLASNCRVELEDLRDELGERPQLADEAELVAIFDDCEPGAIPAIGFGYGVETIVDDQLTQEPDVFFEAGDHRTLIHMEQEEFRRLTLRARHGSFGALWIDS